MINYAELEQRHKKMAEAKNTREDVKTAIAIRYNMDKEAAPRILASGKGSIADEIIRIAEENKVPLYQDPSLAKLLGSLELDTEIPPELYTLVAEVLAFVYKLDQKKGKGKEMQKRLRDELKK